MKKKTNNYYQVKSFNGFIPFNYFYRIEKLIFLLIILLVIQSCNSNKFIVDIKDGQDEDFIKPPSPFLARNIILDSIGEFKELQNGNKKYRINSLLVVNKLYLQVKDDNETRVPFHIFNYNRSWLAHKAVRKIKKIILENPNPDKLDPLHIYLKYTGSYINIYSVWNYNALYDQSNNHLENIS